jgi:hypothetical protein
VHASAGGLPTIITWLERGSSAPGKRQTAGTKLLYSTLPHGDHPSKVTAPAKSMYESEVDEALREVG